MVERPHSRYTREKTWAAFYSQHMNAGYAMVLWSATNNSLDVVWCETPARVKEVEQDFQLRSEELKQHYANNDTPYDSAITAVVLAKSSDYHHYHLAEYIDARLVICGLHDSYLQTRVLEMRTNSRYEPRATVVKIGSPDFERIRGTQFGHNIFIGALVCGDTTAIAYRDDKKRVPVRTRNRIIREVHDLQKKKYQGRPLAFLNEGERRAIGAKISQGLLQYHSKRA